LSRYNREEECHPHLRRDDVEILDDDQLRGERQQRAPSPKNPEEIQGAERNARVLLSQSAPVETVAKLTGLNPDRVRSLALSS